MLHRFGSAIGLVAVLVGQAAAQQTALRGEVQSFEPSFFARYSPNNALDMIQQVPGFSLQEGDTARGFGGTASNVLINGERPSTKNSVSSLLSRIAVANVIRIDLVTGASATLDMRGQTKVANVIVREGAIDQRITYDAFFRGTQDGRLTAQVQAATQRQLFGGTINLSASINTFLDNGPGGSPFVDGQRYRLDGAGAPLEFSEGFTQQDGFVRQLNFEFARDLNLFTLRLNGSWSGNDFDSNRFWQTYAPDAGGSLSGLETNTVRNRQAVASLGGDIERKFGDVDLKLISYNRRQWEDNRARFGTYAPDGSLISASTSAPDLKQGESILRGQATWRMNERHSIEVAVDAAYNFLDNISQFTGETPAGATTFFVDGSDTKVEEFRSELQVSDVWAMLPNLTLEPGFRFESSRIEQDIDYAASPDRRIERKFKYSKPSITATWQIEEGRQLRVSYAREVAQLSFADFVSFADFIANQTTTGNGQLVPERTWALDAQFEQRFGKGGVITLFGTYDEVEDVQDFVPICAGDGPGNIGDGTRWSLGFRSTVPLDDLGLNGARLDASLFGGGSEVTDPVTGETREFSDKVKENWSMTFRQDFPASQFSYVLRLSDSGPSTSYRFNELSRRSRETPDVVFYIETTRWFGLRLRAGIDHGVGDEYARHRLIYGLDPARPTAPPDRSTGYLVRSEQQRSDNGVQLFFRLSGKF